MLAQAIKNLTDSGYEGSHKNPESIKHICFSNSESAYAALKWESGATIPSWREIEAEMLLIGASKDKVQKKRKAWKEYNTYLNAGFTYNPHSKLYQCGLVDQTNWAHCLLMYSTEPNNFVIKIRALDNSMNNITLGKYRTKFIPAVRDHVMIGRNAYWAKTTNK